MQTKTEINRFNTIFVVEPSHDVSALKKYTDNIKFLTTGYEELKNVFSAIEESLLNFDPDMDAVVPIGKLASNLILGVLLARFPRIMLGIYSGRDKDYIFQEVEFDRKI